MPQVRMRTTYAGPSGRTAGTGDVITVPAAEADQLIRGGYATAVEAPRPAPRSRPAETATAGGGEHAVTRLEDLTKDELYAMADSRDIAGRSTMNKAELVQALSEGDEEAEGDEEE